MDMDHIPACTIENTKRSFFTNLLSNDPHNIFKYKPDYWKNESESFIPSVIARFVPEFATKFVDDHISITSASDYSPVYIYMADMEDGHESDVTLNHRLTTLGICVTNSHLSSRHAGNIHIYSYYRRSALTAGLKEFYSFINKLDSTITSFSPHHVWGRTFPDFMHHPTQAAALAFAKWLAVTPQSDEDNAHIKLRLDFEVNPNFLFERGGFTSKPVVDLLGEFFRNTGYEFTGHEDEVMVERFSTQENSISSSDTDLWYGTRYTRDSGHIYPFSPPQPFLRIKIDLHKAVFKKIEENFENLLPLELRNS